MYTAVRMWGESGCDMTRNPIFSLFLGEIMVQLMQQRLCVLVDMYELKQLFRIVVVKPYGSKCVRNFNVDFDYLSGPRVIHRKM